MLRNFVKLDILTAMASINSRKAITPFVIIFAAIGIFALFTQTIIWAVIIAMQVMLQLLHLPFRGEFRNMNALYVLLDVSRKNVVRGRYIYVFAALACYAVFGLVIVLGGFITERALDTHIGALASLHFVIAFVFMQVIAQSLILPILFMHGKGKLSTLTFMPQMLTVLGAFLVMSLLHSDGGAARLYEIMANPQLVGMALFTVLFLVALAVYVSYRVSYRQYCKREF